jgi:phage shock protein PspC (stress-responsive transcriptional regulator)
MNGRLYRSRDDRMLAGVAGGLAEMWDADPSLVRLVWALLVPFTGGIALLAYIVMAIVVPEEDELPAGLPPAGLTPDAASFATPPPGASPAAGSPEGTATGEPHSPVAGWISPYDARTARHDARAARRAARRQNRRGSGAAPAFLGILLVLVGAWFLIREYLPTIDFDWFWPIVLIALGVVVLFMGVYRRPARSDRSSSDEGTVQ